MNKNEENFENLLKNCLTATPPVRLPQVERLFQWFFSLTLAFVRLPPPMFGGSSPTDNVWMMLALNGLDQSKTNWSGCTNYIKSCFNPQTAIDYRLNQTFIDGTSKESDGEAKDPSLYENHMAMLAEVSSFQSVVSADLKSLGYIEKNEKWADDEERPQEVEHRHPGDRPEDDDPSHSDYNDLFQVIVTKATVHSIGFAVPKNIAADGEAASDCDEDYDDKSNTATRRHEGETKSAPTPTPLPSVPRSTEMYAAYNMQFLVRIDPHRKRLIFDCFEAAPHNLSNIESIPLPTRREVELFDALTSMDSHCRGGYSDSEEEEEDPASNQPITFREGVEVTTEKKNAVHLQAETSKFLTARQFRIAFSLDNIVGIRLHYPTTNKAAVMVIELGSPLSEKKSGAFAVRRVMSAQQVDNKFTSIDDWTSNKCASRATRQYIYSDFEELKELAAYLCMINSRIASMFKPAYDKSTNSFSSNSLFSIPSKNLAYDMAPAFVADSLENLLLCGGAGIVPHDSLQALAARALIESGASTDTELALLSEPVKAVVVGEEMRLKNETLQKKTKKKFTVEEVNAQLKAVGFESDDSDGYFSGSCGGCVKQGMVEGKVSLPQVEADLHAIFWTGTCNECDDPVSVTLLDVLNQADYGGSDYPDNTDGAIDCEACGDYGGRQYLTGICYGKPQAISGKFHNHCTQCPEFGECIGDYRTSHCSVCGEHWFQGNSGFPCTGCGSRDGAKRKGISVVDEPYPIDWPGYVGLDELFDSHLSQISQALSSLMQTHGENGENNEMNSMLLEMIQLMGLANEGGSAGGGGDE